MNALNKQASRHPDVYNLQFNYARSWLKFIEFHEGVASQASYLPLRFVVVQLVKDPSS